MNNLNLYNATDVMPSMLSGTPWEAVYYALSRVAGVPMCDETGGFAYHAAAVFFLLSGEFSKVTDTQALNAVADSMNIPAWVYSGEFSDDDTRRQAVLAAWLRYRGRTVDLADLILKSGVSSVSITTDEAGGQTIWLHRFMESVFYSSADDEPVEALRARLRAFMPISYGSKIEIKETKPDMTAYYLNADKSPRFVAKNLVPGYALFDSYGSVVPMANISTAESYVEEYSNQFDAIYLQKPSKAKLRNDSAGNTTVYFYLTDAGANVKTIYAKLLQSAPDYEGRLTFWLSPNGAPVDVVADAKYLIYDSQTGEAVEPEAGKEYAPQYIRKYDDGLNYDASSGGQRITDEDGLLYFSVAQDAGAVDRLYALEKVPEVGTRLSNVRYAGVYPGDSYYSYYDADTYVDGVKLPNTASGVGALVGSLFSVRFREEPDIYVINRSSSSSKRGAVCFTTVSNVFSIVGNASFYQTNTILERLCRHSELHVMVQTTGSETSWNRRISSYSGINVYMSLSTSSALLYQTPENSYYELYTRSEQTVAGISWYLVRLIQNGVTLTGYIYGGQQGINITSPNDYGGDSYNNYMALDFRRLEVTDVGSAYVGGYIYNGTTNEADNASALYAGIAWGNYVFGPGRPTGNNVFYSSGGKLYLKATGAPWSTVHVGDSLMLKIAPIS